MDVVQSPIVPAIADLIETHPDTISLGQGVVWYGPPEQAFVKANREMREAQYQIYGPVEGLPVLREALQAKLHADNGIQLNEDLRLMVTAGSNMAFFNTILAITHPGDEVILLTPYYFNHEMTITMLGCRVVPVATDNNHHPDFDALSAAITDNTRAIVTVSPNNPSGAVYTKAELMAVNALCGQHGLYHISDEAYEYFTFDSHRHFSIASLSSGRQHTISLFSLSKSYGFAGWRIGYAVYPRHLQMAFRKVQDSNLICAASVAQHAAIGALQAGKQYLQMNRQPIQQNRDQAVKQLEQLDCIGSKIVSEGAFYLLLKIDSQRDAVDLCQRLIREFSVAAIPGTPFGIDNSCSIRVSYGALPTDKFELALSRLAKGLQALA